MEEEKKGLPIVFKIFMIILLAILVLFLYIRFIGTRGLVIKEYKIEDTKLPSNFDGFKVVHFSDILYGSTTDIYTIKDVVKKINKLKPDIVLFTGDLLNDKYKVNDKEVKLISDELKKIKATLYKYAIYGDNDYQDNKYEEILKNSNFQLLDNKKVDLYYEGKEPISIYGLSSSIKHKEDLSILNDKNTNYKIILMHESDNINNISNNHPNLVLAGNSLGGQIRIPGIVKAFSTKGSKNYYNDLYKFNEFQMYVSSGIGNNKFKVRLFNHPSINFYRFYTKK